MSEIPEPAKKIQRLMMMAAVIGAVSVLIFLFAERAAANELEFYRDAKLPDWAPFSSAVVVGDTIYVSGHLGRDPETNELVEGGAGPETRQTMRNMKKTLNAVGASFRDVVKCTVFLDDMDDYEAMNEAYVEFFRGPRPARSTIGADGLALGAKVEIECIAARPDNLLKKAH
ncbi:MAG: RidA family protein [Pseudomonadota bacterium]